MMLSMSFKVRLIILVFVFPLLFVELVYQRDNCRRNITVLRKERTAAEDKLATLRKKSLTENSELINEINGLRRENKYYTDQLELVNNKMKLLQRDIKGSIASASSSPKKASLLPSVPASPTSQLEVSSHNKSLRKSASTSKLMPSGRIIHNSSGMSPVATENLRKKMFTLLSQLDDKDRETELQRLENKKLKEQVQILQVTTK